MYIYKYRERERDIYIYIYTYIYIYIHIYICVPMHTPCSPHTQYTQIHHHSAHRPPQPVGVRTHTNPSLYTHTHSRAYAHTYSTFLLHIFLRGQQHACTCKHTKLSPPPRTRTQALTLIAPLFSASSSAAAAARRLRVSRLWTSSVLLV